MRLASLLLASSITVIAASQQQRALMPSHADNGIAYYGGTVMTAPAGVNLYYIWYGDWSKHPATAILTDLARTLGGSPFFNINTTYFDAGGAHVVNAVNFLGSVNDAYSQGSTPTLSQVQTIVSHAISGGLPADPNGVYMVLTSQDVVPAGFCNRLCGLSRTFSLNGTNIKFAWVGNAARCPGTCAPAQPTTGPNGDVGADAMAATLAHLLTNSITNSSTTGWHNASNQGPGSICATSETAFPVTYLAPNGARASVHLGARDFLLQANWVNENGGYCSVSYRR